MPSCSRSFGVVEVALLKKTASTTESNFQIGGNQNGKPQQNSHLEEPSLTIMSTAPRILKEFWSPVNLLNGLKLWNLLISILAEEM